MQLSFILAPVFIVGYFSMSWYFPWGEIALGSSISSSYLFDFSVFILTCILLKKLPQFKLPAITNTFQYIFAILSASICIGVIKGTNLLTPFKYVDQLMLQMIILAPIIEELIFRFSLYELLEKTKLNKWIKNFINAVCFSLSHLPAIWILPEPFHTFIYFQLGYTFFLGLYCAHIKAKSGNDLNVILIHFFFNLTFYSAVKLGLL